MLFRSTRPFHIWIIEILSENDVISMQIDLIMWKIIISRTNRKNLESMDERNWFLWRCVFDRGLNEFDSIGVRVTRENLLCILIMHPAGNRFNDDRPRQPAAAAFAEYLIRISFQRRPAWAVLKTVFRLKLSLRRRPGSKCFRCGTRPFKWHKLLSGRQSISCSSSKWII